MTFSKSVAVCLALVTSFATSAAHALTMGVHLKGDKPFCVYDLSWRLEGLRPGIWDMATRELCTEQLPREDGTFRQYAAGSMHVPALETKLTISYRREPDGPMKQVVFSLKGRLTPTKGRKLAFLQPYLTTTGAVLRIGEIERAAQLADDKVFKFDLDTQEDSDGYGSVRLPDQATAPESPGSAPQASFPDQVAK